MGGWFKAWQTRGCMGSGGEVREELADTRTVYQEYERQWTPNAFASVASLPVRLLATTVSLIQELCRHLDLHHQIGTHTHKIVLTAKQTLLLLIRAQATAWFMPVCESNPSWFGTDCFLSSLEVLQCIIKILEKKLTHVASVNDVFVGMYHIYIYISTPLVKNPCRWVFPEICFFQPGTSEPQNWRIHLYLVQGLSKIKLFFHWFA